MFKKTFILNIIQFYYNPVIKVVVETDVLVYIPSRVLYLYSVKNILLLIAIFFKKCNPIEYDYKTIIKIL